MRGAKCRPVVFKASRRLFLVAKKKPRREERRLRKTEASRRSFAGTPPYSPPLPHRRRRRRRRRRRCRCRRRRRRSAGEKSILSAPRGDVADVARRKTETTVGAGETAKEEAASERVGTRDKESMLGIKPRLHAIVRIARVGSDSYKARRLMRFSAESHQLRNVAPQLAARGSENYVTRRNNGDR